MEVFIKSQEWERRGRRGTYGSLLMEPKVFREA